MPSVTEANWDRALQRTLDTIPSPANRKTVERYLQQRRAANGLKASTLAMEANALRGFCEFLREKPVEAVVRDDIIGYVNEATRVRMWRAADRDGNETVTRRQVRLGASTMAQRKVILKTFFRWLRGTDDDPPEVKGLKAKRPDRNDPIPTDQLLNAEDLRRLIQAHPDARDKAMLAVLYESGLRASEFCSLNVGSVEFDEYGAVLTLPKGAQGLKTGVRRVRLFEARPWLHAWFENHPHKEDPKASLFYSMSRRAPMARMTANALWQFVRRAAKKAAVKKDIHPHLFRHSAATEKARLRWTEAELRAYFGWSRSSDMPSRYVHLAGLDYERMELQRRGLLKEGQGAKPALAPRICQVCRSENLPTAMFCQSCRHPVSPGAEEELRRRRREEMKEELAKMWAGELKEEIAEEFRRSLVVKPRP